MGKFEGGYYNYYRQLLIIDILGHVQLPTNSEHLSESGLIFP